MRSRPPPTYRRRVWPVVWLLRSTIPLLPIILVGCDRTDPYKREGVWRSGGANEASLRAMVVVPSGLSAATHAGPADGQLAAAAISQLPDDRVRQLPDSALTQVVPIATAPLPAAAPTPGSGQ
jgi:hypothetical protein